MEVTPIIVSYGLMYLPFIDLVTFCLKLLFASFNVLFIYFWRGNFINLIAKFRCVALCPSVLLKRQMLFKAFCAIALLCAEPPKTTFA